VLPHHHHQASRGTHGSTDVGKRGDWIREEHRPEPADRDVEALSREVMDLGVGLLERDVVQPFGFRQPAGSLDHRRGEVYAHHTAGRGQAPGVTGRLAFAAPDVEHLIGGTNVVGAAQDLVVQSQFGIVADPATERHCYHINPQAV
jgi:hypothetical protein